MSGESAEVLKTLGRHDAEIEQSKKDKTAIFDLYNTKVMPALSALQSEMKVITENNKHVALLLKETAEKATSVEAKQTACETARKAQLEIDRKLDTSSMNRWQKAGVFTAVVTFLLSCLAGAAFWIHKAAKILMATGQ